MLMGINRVIFIALVLFIHGRHLCSIEMCFTWKVNLNSLTLICKLNSLKHRIFIDNQRNVTVADCFKRSCDSYYSNGSISLTKEKNQTIYIVKGIINEHVNGNWTCRHGRNKDIAIVDVTVLTIKDSKNMKINRPSVSHDDDSLPDAKNEIAHVNCSNTRKDYQSESNGETCSTTLFCWFIGSFVVSLMFFRLLTSVMVKWCGIRLDDKLDNGSFKCFTCIWKWKKETVNVMKSTFLIVLILIFIGVVLWIGNTEKRPCSHIAISVLAVVGSILGMSSSIFIISITDDRPTSGNGSLRTSNNRPTSDIRPLRTEQMEEETEDLNVPDDTTFL